MSNDTTGNGNYRLTARLLARKGSAEPLQAKGGGLVLSRGAESPEEDSLVDAVVNSTLDLLAAGPDARPTSKAPAALTDLFDPALARGSTAGHRD